MKLRFGIAGIVAIGLVLPSGASASEHQIKIREVFPGSSLASTVQWVELQMYSPGQNLFSTGSLVVYGPLGGVNAAKAIDTPVANSENQRRVLVGSPATEGETGVAPDFVIEGPMMSGSGGAVCFLVGGSAIDCVSWGDFSTSPRPYRRGDPYPGPSGLNAPAIPDGSSLERSIAALCPGLLEDADDTDSSLSDFTSQPSPLIQNNASPVTDLGCTSSLKAKRKQKIKRSPKIRAIVTSNQNGSAKLSGTAKVGKKKFKLKRRNIDLTADTPQSVKLKASKKLYKKIRQSKEGKATIKARVTYGSGTTELLKKKIKLKR